MSTPINRRILLIDDTPAIHDDFRKILTPETVDDTDLDAIENVLFGIAPKTASTVFELDSAYGGQEGLNKLLNAEKNKRPYALAFVDMRMPDGWDGAQTIEQLWKCDPLLQIVVCTAYSDYSWEELLDRLKGHDRLLILKKPFDNIEMLQMANTLTNKWEMTSRAQLKMGQLEDLVEQRTQDLQKASTALQEEIDERKSLQVQLIQSEKLASLGQLAAGVAHEINNPVGFISSNFSSLDNYFKQFQQILNAYIEAECSINSPQTRQSLEQLRTDLDLDFILTDGPLLIKESKEGLERVSRIVKDLKDFSRVDSTQEWQWANLQQGIDSTLNIVATEVKYKADVIKKYTSLPEVECLPSQINQVIMNLIVNAAQSFGTERGTITLSNGVDGQRVWIDVSDTGSGIAPENLKRIFDPFYTTKPVGQGTGLGLSLSYGIIKKHHGDIEVFSEIGKGTTFRVILPIKQTTESP